MYRNGKNIGQRETSFRFKKVLAFLAAFLIFFYLHFYYDLIKFLPAIRNYEVVFYGDSLLKYGEWNLGVSIKNNAKGGNTTTNLLAEINQKVLRYHPKICVLNGGINDLRYGKNPEDVATNYQLILSIFKEHRIKVLIQETLPVYSQNIQWENELNGKVTMLNELVMNLDSSDFCRLNKHLRLMPYEYKSDGIHLNSNVYVRWNKYLLEKVNNKAP